MSERNDDHDGAGDAAEQADREPAENAEQADREPVGVDRQEAPATRHEERAPLDDLSREVRERREREAQEQPAESDLFEAVDVGEIDAEQVWEEIVSEEERAEGKAVGAGSEAEKVGSGGPDQRPEHLLPKSEFCGRCPYLTEPPELACSHEGTDIVEVADVDHFRVRGCPFAAEDEPSFEELG